MKTIIFTYQKVSRTALEFCSIAALSLLAVTAHAPSPADTLEKGIYTEETKGDLPGAIALYEQALAEAKSKETFAAQALYRLALCHRKLNHEQEANELFRRLVEDYPEQDLATRAKDLLSGELA